MSSISTVCEAGAVGAGRDRAFYRLRFGRGDRLLAGEVAIDLVGFAADLGDRGADRVGAIAVRHADHLARSRRAGRAPETRRRRPRSAARRRLRSSSGRSRLRVFARAGVEHRLGRYRAAGRRACRRRRSRRCRQPPRHRSRSRFRRRIPAPPRSSDSRRCPARRESGSRLDDAAAAEPDRQQVGHAEQRAHAAHLDHRIRFARKAAGAAGRHRSTCRRHRRPSRP